MFLRDAFNIILGNDRISIFHDQHLLSAMLLRQERN